MIMKRYLLSVVLAVFATVTGVVFSFNPAVATAVGSDGNRYVALGDSVAAGAGLPQGIGIPEEQACARSEQAYPYKVAAAQGMYVEHLACSGAKVDEGLYGPQAVSGNSIPPQLDRAYASGTPDLITVTIGANDARWAQFVAQCFQWDCGSSVDNARVAVYLADLRWELYQTMVKIRNLSGNTPPQVIFTGYFVPFNPAGPSCADTRNFTAAEMTWMNAQVSKLNQVIRRSVAHYTFATYAPVDFAGHEVCSSDPWIQGVQASAPMHPTAAGQTAMAHAVSAVMTERGGELLSASATSGEFVEDEPEQQGPSNSVDQENTQANEANAQDSTAGVVVEQANQPGQDNTCNADDQVGVL
jgi:lysophospholipase L1-like esterase